MNIKKKLNKFKDTLATKKFPVIIIGCLVVLIGCFYAYYNTYKETFTIEIDGYMISNESIDNLKEEKIEKKESISTVNVKSQDVVSKNSFNKYVAGNKKQEVNTNYPLYVNKGLTIVNYNSNINLINKNFNRVTGFENMIISYGKIYDDTTYSQIDQESYILLQYENGIFINLYDLKIKTIVNSYEIPVKNNTNINYNSDM